MPEENEFEKLEQPDIPEKKVRDLEELPEKDNIDFSQFETDFVNKDIVVKPNPIGQRLDINLNSSKGQAGAIIKRLVIFTSADATPSVKNANLFITAGTTAITDFDDGVVGHVIYIKATANITITDGSPIILNGSADYAMTDTDTLTLAMFDDQVWQEISRSVN